MIGKYQIQLGADQFISGMSSSDYATDGALGTSSSGLNPFATAGIVRAMAAPVDLSTNVAGSIIASAEDSQTTTGYGRTFVDDAGNYYTYSAPSTVTKTNTATTNSSFYTAFLTDMVSFQLNTYVTTSNGDIDKWNTSSLTLTNSWWVGTKSQTAMTHPGIPHSMEVYQGMIYVADKNKLHTIDGSETISLGVLVLNTNEIIYAMGIDPQTGLLMLSVQTTVNASDNLSSRYFVYLYDGISAKPTRKIPVDDLVTAFHNVEGQVYVGQGIILGAWNGNGVTFMRKLQNLGYVSSDLVYKHRMTNTRNVLHVVDGPSVLSYGAVLNGKKGFFYTAFNPSGSGHLSSIMPMAFEQIGIAYTTNQLSKFSYLDTGSGIGVLYFNNIYFPRPVFIRRIRVMTTGITTNTVVGGCQFTDEKGVTYTTQTTAFKVLAASSPRYVFDFDYTAEVQSIQPKINIDGQGFGIVRIIIYYDIAQ